MGDSSDNTPIDTLECLSNCEQLFSKLLARQANIFKDRRRTKVLTDREVRDAFDSLVVGRRPSFWAILLSHGCEIMGGGIAAFGWHFARDHKEFVFESWTMILGGIVLFLVGIVVREFLARK